MRRIILSLIAVTVLLTVTFASAAALDVSSDGLGAGGASVVACGGTPEVEVIPDDGGPVTSVAVSGLADCEGGRLTVTLTDAGVELATATAEIDAQGAGTANFDPAVPGASDVQIIVIGGS